MLDAISGKEKQSRNVTKNKALDYTNWAHIVIATWKDDEACNCYKNRQYDVSVSVRDGDTGKILNGGEPFAAGAPYKRETKVDKAGRVNRLRPGGFIENFQNTNRIAFLGNPKNIEINIEFGSTKCFSQK